MSSSFSTVGASKVAVQEDTNDAGVRWYELIADVQAGTHDAAIDYLRSVDILSLDATTTQVENTLVVGENSATQEGLRLANSQTGGPATRRGGMIEWENNTATVTHLYNASDGIGIGPTAQSGSTINSDYLFKLGSTGAFTCADDLTIEGDNFNWTVETAFNLGMEWTPWHKQTGGGTDGAWVFRQTVTGYDDASASQEYSQLATMIRESAAANPEGELHLKVTQGGTSAASLAACVGDVTTPGFELETGVRLGFDASISAAVGTITTQGDTYFVKNGTDLELWVDGTLEQTWTSGGGGGGGDSYLEWAGL